MAEELLDAGHLYEPQWWPHKTAWKPPSGQCRIAVHDDGGRPSWHQCSRKSKVEREVNHLGKNVSVEYCAIHDPVKIKEKNEKRMAAWREKWRAQDEAANEVARQRRLNSDAVDAIRQIASGHNDPRSLAIKVLSDNGEIS